MGGFSDKMGNGKYFERSLGMPLQWLRLYKGVCDGFVEKGNRYYE